MKPFGLGKFLAVAFGMLLGSSIILKIVIVCLAKISTADIAADVLVGVIALAALICFAKTIYSYNFEGQSSMYRPIGYSRDSPRLVLADFVAAFFVASGLFLENRPIIAFVWIAIWMAASAWISSVATKRAILARLERAEALLPDGNRDEQKQLAEELLRIDLQSGDIL